ncbi:MFS transporter [Microlunatus sp. Gsoil 973]|uniref:MFS transporter n=1 Tax=Microlunatus sp. Gsoil 973 TaxID=2672569 RepID=UPI0012B48723|nr:MFS transporter [Microlunatus sp. Gsoil 973]QGN34558.1 MFS transporter [Microlunatus sp. Gsoil 973]
MEFVRGLRQLWRHPMFRRLFAVRVAAQAADAVLQVALASYVLFSPERQPDAAAIAGVLALTLLPFSVLGPFVSVVLDRVSRRQVLLITEIIRAVLGISLAALVAGGIAGGSEKVLFYGGVLLAMSFNRFLLAALSASLPHTITPEEYLVANSVVPTIGPAAVIIGGGAATGLRLLLSNRVPTSTADAVLFALATCGFMISAALSLRIGRRLLGPDGGEPTRTSDVVRGLVAALRHLRERREAGLGLIMIGLHRVPYGVVTVATILVYRNYFHTVGEVDAAIGELGILALVTGTGFVLAAAVTPIVRHRIGARAWMISCFVASAFLQTFPGATYTRAGILISAFLCGVLAQAIKINVDTFVQAHVDDEFKGRVFVLYDMIFNVALVGAAAISALILPINGRSVLVLVIISACYLLTGLAFAVLGRGLAWDQGAESLTAVEVGGPPQPDEAQRDRAQRGSGPDAK